MTRHSLRGTGLALAAMMLATLAIAAVPPAAANVQTTLTVSIDPPTEPIRPLSEVRVLTGRVTYGYVGLVAPTSLQPTKITLSAVPPAWASVVVSPSTLHIPLTKTDAVASEEATFSVLVTALADAPAFSGGNIQITARAEQNGQLVATSDTGEIPIQADFIGLLSAAVQQPIRLSTPQKPLQFPVTVANFGNAQTKVTFEVVNATGGLNVPIPQPLTLDSRVGGGKVVEATRFIEVMTPHRSGYVNDAGAITVRLSSAYAHDPSKRGDEVVLSLLVNTKGFYAPGPEPLLLLGALLGLALVLGRARGARAARSARR